WMERRSLGPSPQPRRKRGSRDDLRCRLRGTSTVRRPCGSESIVSALKKALQSSQSSSEIIRPVVLFSVGGVMALVLEPPVRRVIERFRHKPHDKRIAQRLSALLWVADGKTQLETAQLLGVTQRQVRKWLRLFRTAGLEALCTLHHRGDPGNLRPAQIERLKAEIATGRFLTAKQISDWLDETFHVRYTARGGADLLPRNGVGYTTTQ